MFCPKCRAEYKPGITECADCKIPLVSVLPPEPKPEFVEYGEVLATFNIGDIAIIKSLLDKEGITYFFKGDRVQITRPMAEPARLMVKSDHIAKAIEILKDLDLHYLTFSVEGE